MKIITFLQNIYKKRQETINVVSFTIMVDFWIYPFFFFFSLLFSLLF